MRVASHVSLLFELEPACVEFEDALRAGRTPCLEQRLTGLHGERRLVLFRELLALELHYSRSRGTEVDLARYRASFPEYERAITDVVRQSQGDGGGSGLQTPDLAPGGTFGAYTIVRELGRGGMGVVYEARHSALQRSVALKVLLAGTAGSTAEERFRREAHATARLHHGNIAPVFEVGEVDGAPYFAMQLIEGASLADAIQGEAAAGGGDLDAIHRVDRLLRAHAALARALHYAHERGVLHRDVKPSNVLIDGQGVPWLVDFGLARVDESDLTADNDLLGTLRYMPPERFAGQADARSDVYALGLTLYEALTLVPARSGGDASALMRAALERDVPALRRALPRASRDLETVLSTAVAREPERRYATAAAFADDLERCLTRTPVAARPLGPLTRLGRWTLRNRAAALALALLTVVAVGGVAAAFVFQRQRDDIAALSSSTARHLRSAEEARDAARTAHYLSDIQRAAQAAASTSSASAVSALLASWAPGPAAPGQPPERDLRGFEWAFVRSLVDDCVVDLWRTESGGAAVDWQPGGELVAMAGRGGASLWRASDGAHVRDLATGGHPRCVQFDPSGKLLAVTDMDGARVFDVESGALLASHALDGDNELAWHPDGRRLALRGPRLVVWDFRDDRVEAEVSAQALNVQMAFDPAGQHLAFSVDPKRVRVVETSAWSTVGEVYVEAGLVCDVAFHPDGSAFAVASRTHAIHVFDRETWEGWAAGSAQPMTAARLVIEGAHGGVINAVRFSPDGRFLVSASGDASVRVWDAGSGALLRTFLGHPRTVIDAVFAHDNRRVASTAVGGNLRIWDLAQPPAAATYDVPAPVGPGGARLEWRSADELAVAGRAGWTVMALGAAPPAGQVEAAPVAAMRSPDGALALEVDRGWARVRAVEADHALAAVEVGRGSERRPVDRGEYVLGWSADSSKAYVAVHGSLFVLERAGAGFHARYQPTDVPVDDFALEPNGARLALPGWDTVRILDVATGAVTGTVDPALFDVPGHDYAVPRFGAAPGQFAVLHGARVLLLDPSTFAVRAILDDHPQRIFAIAWSPDGRRLATGDGEGTVRLYDRSHRLTLAIPAARALQCLAWSPDGRRLAALGERGARVTVFDASLGYRHLAATGADHGPPGVDRFATAVR